MEQESLLSDALLKQLMAVGQVDILVGLPTLNNAGTVGAVARAINACFVRDFPRLRTVMINSDAGSTDGTPDVIRNTAFVEGDVVQTTHTLRTLHRVVTPYHGLPGKLTALQLIFAATTLTQARTLVVVDPAGPATTPERITDMIGPVLRRDVEFLAPRHRRHPLDGPLVTQLVRPLVRAIYDVGLDEPLGAEFSCSGRFAAHCLDRDIWGQDAARFAIDLWLRTEAVANAFPFGQIWRAAPVSPSSTTLRQVVRQIFLSLAMALREHAVYWTAASKSVDVCTWGQDDGVMPPAPEWDHAALGQQARRDITQIRPLLEEVLAPPMVVRMLETTPGDLLLDDELWVRSVYAFIDAVHKGAAALEHLADMFVPIYMWRAASFMGRVSGSPPDVVQQQLNMLCDAFQRLRPLVVEGWTSGK